MVRQKNILFAEDDMFLKECVSEIILGNFSEVNLEICEDGVSLEKKLRQGPNGTHLILTDNQMPGPNGS